MTTRRSALFGVMGTLALSAAAFAFAPAGNAVRVKIPFSFELGEKTLPAGQYVIGRAPTGNTMYIKSSEGDVSAFITSPAGNPNQVRNPHLLFEKLGAGYRLAEIYLADGSIGSSITPTRRQTLISEKQPSREYVELALVLR